MERMLETKIRLIPVSKPGKIPAAKSFPMEAPVKNPNMIMGMLGGMITPIEPPDACTALANSGS